ncbi:hypothetical protein F5882DRAFT_423286, partial [Hyaloscypha sp. PMI_1271]
EERGRWSQGCRGSYPTTYPQGKKGGSGRVLHSRLPLYPVFINVRQSRDTSEDGTNDTYLECSCMNINPRQAPEHVAQVSLPLRPIKPEPGLNGSVVKESKEMESSRRPDYESTGMPHQRTVPPRTIIPNPPNEASSSNPRLALTETPPTTGTLKFLSKQDEIQLYTLLQRIRRLRELIWGLRSRIQEQRGILRSKQYAKAAADDKYMQLARLKESRVDTGTHFISNEGKTLQELFQDCEQMRSEYGPLEDDCNALEDQLEENFDSQSPSPDIILDGRSERSSSDGIQNFHPLVANYLSKLGDVDIFRERHERLLEEKEGLEGDRETRRGVNLTLAPEDEAWLEQSDQLEDEILKDLQEAQTEAEELRKKCLAAGLLDEDGEPKDFQTQEQDAFAEDVDAKGRKSEYLKFPTLLPQPGSTDMKFKASAPRPGEQSGSAGDHINQWLLHCLRSSPLDVYLLAKTFEAESDDASQYQIDSITSETPVYGRSKLPEESSHDGKTELVLGITGRERAVSDTSSISGGVDPLPRSQCEGRRI